MDQKEKVKLFSLVSFCVLMQHGEGIMSKAPDYILKKVFFLRSPVHMFDILDDDNRNKVIEYGKKWGEDFTELINQMAKDYEEIPASEFKEKYFVL